MVRDHGDFASPHSGTFTSWTTNASTTSPCTVSIFHSLTSCLYKQVECSSTANFASVSSKIETLRAWKFTSQIAGVIAHFATCPCTSLQCHQHYKSGPARESFAQVKFFEPWQSCTCVPQSTYRQFTSFSLVGRTWESDSVESMRWIHSPCSCEWTPASLCWKSRCQSLDMLHL